MASPLFFVALLLLCGCCFTAGFSRMDYAKSLSVQPECPDGWTGFDSQCFSFYNETKSWSDAEAFCNSVGGNLASIHESDENDFVMDLLGETTVWIGGTFETEEGQWTWTDDSEFDYTHWAPEEPHNAGGTAICMEISPGEGGWKDVECDILSAFVCGKDA